MGDTAPHPMSKEHASWHPNEHKDPAVLLFDENSETPTATKEAEFSDEKQITFPDKPVKNTAGHPDKYASTEKKVVERIPGPDQISISQIADDPDDKEEAMELLGNDWAGENDATIAGKN